VFGADADVVAVSHRTIANLLIDGGHPTEALPHLQRAIAIGEHNHGAGAVEVAGAYASLGTAYHDLHRFADARPLLERAVAAYERAGQFGNLGIAEINLADLLIATNHLDDALATARRAQDALERGMGTSSSVVGFALYDQARCLNATGKPTDAIPLLERALTLMDPATSDPDNVPMFQFELARALWDAGRDRAHAVELATKAHAAFDKLGDAAGAASQRAESAAWLASHHAR
jgi:tetratricopeptide (TPR) repeat protein